MGQAVPRAAGIKRALGAQLFLPCLVPSWLALPPLLPHPSPEVPWLAPAWGVWPPAPLGLLGTCPA